MDFGGDSLKKYIISGAIALLSTLAFRFCGVKEPLAGIFGGIAGDITKEIMENPRSDEVNDLKERVKRLEENSGSRIETPKYAAYDPTHISQPVHNLFSAWRRLDLQLYMDQWDRSATQHSKKFSSRNYEDILSRRRALFGKLSRVDVVKYDITDLKQEAEGRVSLQVKYSMVFYFTNGKSITESDVTEKYVLSYDDMNKRWRILYNHDYID